MATKRVKVDCGETVDKECHIMLEDLISQLPDSLIHHIFSFLPTIYLVRMSFLSKRWRHMWISTPFLYFEDLKGITFNNNVRNRKMVLKFMTSYLGYRKKWTQIPDTSILSFRCDIKYNFTRKSSFMRRIDDWLSFVVQNKVKELDLYVKKYCLPQFILNASSLTILKLVSVEFFAPSLSTLPSLKVLSLICEKSDVKSLQNLISGCPVIEKLHLKVSYKVGPIDFVVGGTLKCLSLCLDLNDRWLDALISGLPLLERLALKLFSLKNISFSSHSLKNVSIGSINFVEEIALTTPNLVCLHLECRAKSIILVQAPNLLEANLELADVYMLKASYMALVNLLSNLNFLRKMMLCIRVEQVLIFLKSVRKKCPPPLPNLEHLKVEILYGRREKTAALRDSLLWCAPSLKTLQINKEMVLINN